MATALPFIKFFPRDWMGDEKLRLCSIAARGLWMEILCMMHSNTIRRGYLATFKGTPKGAAKGDTIGDCKGIDEVGRPIPNEQLARAVGVTPDELITLLDELETAGVFSRDESGLIYSRRMVQEQDFRDRCSAAGLKGGGNPKLRTFKGAPKGDDKGDAKGCPKPQTADSRQQILEDPLTPATGATVAKTKPKPESVPIPPGLDVPDFLAVWGEWIAERSARKKPLTERAAAGQLDALAEIGAASAIECIRASIRNQWQGLFPERFRGGGNSGNNLLDFGGKKESRMMAQMAEGLAAP